MLLEAGFELVTVADLAGRADGRRAAAGPRRASFDDGMENNHSVLLPILREYGIPATVYVTTGMIGEPNPWLGAGVGRADDDRGRASRARGAGVELGAHTVTHPDLSLWTVTTACARWSTAGRAIEELTGAPRARSPTRSAATDRPPWPPRERRLPGRGDLRGPRRLEPLSR